MANNFAAQIEKHRKKYEKRMILIHKKISLDMFRKVILKTPVDTGRARGNWMLGINQIPQGVSEDADGKEAIRNIITGLNALSLGDTSVLANSVPYISVLEYGGFPNPPKKGSYVKGTGKRSKRTGKFLKGGQGHYVIKSEGGYSRQAPNGMIRASIEEYRATLNKAISLAKRETP